jgi:hypothetical protein
MNTLDPNPMDIRRLAKLPSKYMAMECFVQAGDIEYLPTTKISVRYLQLITLPIKLYHC